MRAGGVRADGAGRLGDYRRDHDVGRSVVSEDFGGQASRLAMTMSRVVGVGRSGEKVIPVERMGGILLLSAARVVSHKVTSGSYFRTILPWSPRTTVEDPASAGW